MLIIFSTDLFYLLDKSLTDIFVQVLDVEVLVLFIKIKKKLFFKLDLLIDSQKCWNFIW